VDAKEITRRLFVGAHAIDRMRNEVDETVRMLVGLMKQCSFDPLGFSASFESSSCEWIVVTSPYSRPDIILVKCLVKEDYGKKSGFSSQRGEFPFHTRDVQRVYESLPVLVEGLLKIFPELELRWKPLIDASLVDFET
jgi:hypothetical protein